MGYSVFNTTNNNQLKEPMFLGQNVNVSRYDQQKYKIFETLIEKQLSFFWRPEEIDVSKDRIDYQALPENEKHIFISNLKYQTLLDSIQGRSPNMAFLPIVSLPELETWIETWSFSETIHSRSYTHIIRNIVGDPSVIFDDIVANEEIMKRAVSVSKYYDDIIEKTAAYYRGEVSAYEVKKSLYLCMLSVNILEAVRFYVSFACSFAFAERNVMEGNAKIIKLIARDEQLHLSGTQHIIKLMHKGEDDPDFKQIAAECREEGTKMFLDAAEQEKDWAKYLFKDGSMLGLNESIVCNYIEYITNLRAKYLSFPTIYKGVTKNPLPWINNWLGSDNLQPAPQEVEISSYLVGQINSAVDTKQLSGFTL
jgi:ribonucleoside-diphosphate reductase beta chain